MFCHKCGTQISDGSVFCPKCGTKVVFADANQQPTDLPMPDAKGQQASGEKENTKQAKQASSNNTAKTNGGLRKAANIGRVLMWGSLALLFLMSFLPLRINPVILVAGVAIGMILSAFGAKRPLGISKIIELVVGVILLAAVAIYFVSFGGESDKYIQIVKSGTLDAYPQKTVGEAFDGFLDDPEWESGLSDNDERFVNVKGEILYDDEKTEIIVQFIVDEENNSFQYNACEIDGIPQNNLVFWGLLEAIYNGGSTSTESDSQSGSNSKTQSFAQDYYGNMEVTLEYAQFTDIIESPWTDGYEYPDEGFVFLRVAFTVKNIGTANSIMPSTKLVYDGAYEFDCYSTEGDISFIPPLAEPREGASIFMVPTTVMESEKSLVFKSEDSYGKILLSYTIRPSDVLLETSEFSDQTGEETFSYDTTVGFSESLEYYSRLSGSYDGRRDQKTLSVSIYSSLEEGEAAIGTVGMYVGDEWYYIGEIVAEPEWGVYQVATDTGEEVVLAEYSYDNTIVLELSVNGEVIDEYWMVEHYEP